MIAVDTNILVRLLVTGENPSQTERVRRLFHEALHRNEPVLIPVACILESVWVWLRVYRLTKSQVVEFVEALFRTAGLEFESRIEIVLALDDWKNGPGDFGDYLIRACARNMGATGVATFDQTLHTESGFFPPPA